MGLKQAGPDVTRLAEWWIRAPATLLIQPSCLSLALFLPLVIVPLTLEHFCSVLKEETRTPQLHIGGIRVKTM